MSEKEAKEKVEDIEKQVEEAVKEVREEPAEKPGNKAVAQEEKEEAVKKEAEPAKEEAAPEEAAEKTDASESAGDARPKREFREEREIDWTPRTKLGRDVQAGKYKSLDQILQKGELILEPEIVDFMVPELMQEVVYIGGSPGKGGGIRRTATKMTARMHKSGRRFKLSALAIVGNGDGIVGMGRATSTEHRTALEKATKNAKLGVIRVKRGCGSWECGCGGGHSVPFKVNGNAGSVHVTVLPAPKGVGIVASEEVRKILKLAGIKDAWVKTSGSTSTRANLTLAFFDALKNLNSGKGDL